MLPHLVTAIPGPKSRAFAAQLRKHESRNVTFIADDWPIFWQRATGTNVWDVDGNCFLDLTSAFGVASLGHNHEAVRAALLEQAGELIHAMGDVHPAARKAELCDRLSALTFERWGLGAGKVILGNSGFEAVEAALKTSLLHSGKSGVIAFTGGYHGLGLGALATTGISFFRDPFRAQLKDFAVFLPYPHCFHCPFGAREKFRLEGRDFPNCATPCLESLHDQIEDILIHRAIGCILVEPMQGRGGCVVPPRDFLTMLRTICDSHKILLIADEIFTGFNRTGALFACEHSGVFPDLICLGKSLTGGFPLSACVGRGDIMDAWPASSGEALHTSTFLGHPLGCAMSLAALEQHSHSELALHVRERGAKFKAALYTLRHPALAHVRGVGLMLGAELLRPNGDPDPQLALAIVKESLRQGLLLLADTPLGNVLSFAPPFSISDEEIAFVVQTLARILATMPSASE